MRGWPSAPRSLSRRLRRPRRSRLPLRRTSASPATSSAPRLPPLPPPAEIRQARGDAEEEHPQKTRLSLLQRLANVGLGRRDEETEPPIAARASGPSMSPLPERKPQRSVAQQMAGNEPVSEYARRP